MCAVSSVPAISKAGVLLLLAGLLLRPLAAPAQPVETTLYNSTAEDIALAKMVLQDLAAHADSEPAPALLVRAARQLLGQPYVAGTQEGREERLRIYLTRTDCILFAETCLGLVQAAQARRGGATFEDVARAIRGTRYSDARTPGSVQPYATRVHYVTEWIAQGAQKGIFRDVTAELGGVPDTRRIDFMSKHPDSYAPLKGESQYARDNLADITRMEGAVSRMPRSYIPKEKLAAAEGRIRSGDILCFATSIEGLDYSHVVIAYREKPGDRLGFIHASSAAGKVVVEPRTLEAYLQANQRITGVTVLRLE